MPMLRKTTGPQDLGIRTRWLMVHRGARGEIIVQRTPSGIRELPDFWTAWFKDELAKRMGLSDIDSVNDYADSVHIVLGQPFELLKGKIEQTVRAIHKITSVLLPVTENLYVPYERTWRLSDDAKMTTEVIDQRIKSLRNASAFFDVVREDGGGDRVLISMLARKNMRPSEGQARRFARLVEHRFAQATASASARA